jgi:hypothetical protein
LCTRRTSNDKDKDLSKERQAKVTREKPHLLQLDQLLAHLRKCSAQGLVALLLLYKGDQASLELLLGLLQLLRQIRKKPEIKMTKDLMLEEGGENGQDG